MNKLISWFMISATAIALMGCPKCADPGYRFSPPMHVRPETEFVTVGDTVWLESSLSTTLRDGRSGQDVVFSDAVNFGSYVSVSELRAGSDTLIHALNRFTPLLLVGTLNATGSNATSTPTFSYAENGAQYRLRLGFVCRQKGIFSLAVGIRTGVRQRGQNPCEGALLSFTIDNTDKHLQYLQDLYYKTKPIADQVKGSTYCFVVR